MTSGQNKLSNLLQFEGKGLTFSSKKLDPDHDRVFYIERDLFETFGFAKYLYLSCNDHIEKNGVEDCDCIERIKVYISMWVGHGGAEFIVKDNCGIIETNENREIRKQRAKEGHYI